MKYFPGTNICVHYFREQFDLEEKIQDIDLRNCAIPQISLPNLPTERKTVPTLKRTLKLSTNLSNRSKSYRSSCHKHFRKRKARLRKKGTMISDFDILFGSTSIANGLIMVTENLKDLERISKIKIENWVKR